MKRLLHFAPQLFFATVANQFPTSGTNEKSYVFSLSLMGHTDVSLT